jgi:histidinol-phosphatase (PHP family)
MPKGPNYDLDYNYHSHTWRCGHATGTDEAYVKSAIANGFKIYGFSDHVILPNASQPGMRGDYILLDGYINSVRELALKYQDQIAIHLGFEAEWYGDLYRKYYHDLLAEHRVDYLILGQHDFIQGHRFHWYASVDDKDDALDRYVKDLTEGMRSGLFTYVAHPDHFMSYYPRWDDHAIKAAETICQVALEMDLPLEVNMGPSRWGRKNAPGEEIRVAYPFPQFWDVVARYGCKVILGVDDHDPSELTNSPYDWVFAFIKNHHLNYISRVCFPVIS